MVLLNKASGFGHQFSMFHLVFRFRQEASLKGSRLASGFKDLSCFDGKGKETRLKHDHQNVM